MITKGGDYVGSFPKKCPCLFFLEKLSVPQILNLVFFFSVGLFVQRIY